MKQLYRRMSRSWVAGVVVTVAGLAALVAVMAPIRGDVGLLNAGLVLLLFVLCVSSVWGRNVGIFAAVLANITLNFFFIEPVHRLTVGSRENVVALAIFLAVSLVGGTLLANARTSAASAARREREMQALLSLNRAMLGRVDPVDALDACCRELLAAFSARGAAVLQRLAVRVEDVEHELDPHARTDLVTQ